MNSNFYLPEDASIKANFDAVTDLPFEDKMELIKKPIPGYAQQAKGMAGQ